MLRRRIIFTAHNNKTSLNFSNANHSVHQCRAVCHLQHYHTHQRSEEEEEKEEEKKRFQTSLRHYNFTYRRNSNNDIYNFIHKKNSSTKKGSLQRNFSTDAESSSTPTPKKEQSFSSIAATTSLLQQLLTNEQRTILSEQKELISRVTVIVSQMDNVEMRDCSNRLLDGLIPTKKGGGGGSGGDGVDEEAEETALVDSTFAIVIAGEFNAGKSTLINALLGQKLLETGALPTTDAVTIVANDSSKSPPPPPTTTTTTSSSQPKILTTRHNSSTLSSEGSGGIGTVTLHRIQNIPILQDLTFIDTPGTNAVITDHTSKTVKLLPSADLILFVTSADRPFPDSEKQLLKSIQTYRKNIVILINKMDVLEMMGGNYGETEKKRVVDFVKENASDLLGVNPIVIPISARDALAAKLMHGTTNTTTGNNSSANEQQQKHGYISSSSSSWKRSNFQSLESFLQQTLTAESKLQSKLLNPIGVAEGMLSDCLHELSKTKQELQVDTATLNLLESQMNGWSKEMEESMGDYRMEMLDVLKREGGRCERLVDGMSYLQQWSWCLLDADGRKFDVEWNRAKKGGTISVGGDELMNDIEAEVAAIVRESSDSIATKARAQGQAVIEYLGKRPAVTSQSLIGSVTAASRFEDTRNEMSTKMTKSVRDVLSDHDPIAERNEVAQSLKQTIILSAMINASALTSGISTTMELLDLTTGSVSTSVLAILGVSIVPYRNKQTVAKIRSTWEQRCQSLDEALEVLGGKEMQRIQKRIMDGVAPYTRYVRTERERVDILMNKCEDCQSDAHSLRNRIIKTRSL